MEKSKHENKVKKHHPAIFLIILFLITAIYSILFQCKDIIDIILVIGFWLGFSLFIYYGFKMDTAGEKIFSLSFEYRFSKDIFILFIPIIASIFLLYFFHDIIFGNYTLVEFFFMIIASFIISSIAGIELYFFFSHPRILWSFIIIVNKLLNIYSKIKKEEPYNETIFLLTESEKMGSILDDYSYFFVHLVIISFLSPLIFLNIYSEPYSKLSEMVSQDILVLSLFSFLVIISPIFFSLDLSGFYWKKRRITPSIFYKLLIPSLIIFITKLSIGKNKNQIQEINFFLATIFFIFLISAFSFGFLFVREYSIKRIRESNFFERRTSLKDN